MEVVDRATVGERGQESQRTAMLQAFQGKQMGMSQLTPEDPLSTLVPARLFY